MHRPVFASVCGIALFVVILAGCNMSTPSQVKTGQIRIKQDVRTETLDAFHMYGTRVDSIARDYLENGRGPLRLVMSYGGGAAGEKAIHGQADIYKKAFARRGVKGVQVDYVSVSDASLAGKVVLSYMALQALAPENCRRIVGHKGAEALEDFKSYAVGCETKTVMSKMVVRPEDLMGNTGMPEDDSRRHGAVVEKYVSGTQNTKLDGLNASAIGN